MAEIYFLIFWIPAFASLVSLRLAWASGLLNRPILILAWFGLALILQMSTHRLSPGWAVGLTLQAMLAVYLGIRIKLDS